GHFVIGHIPTGSNDPYALRRQANGIVQILFDTPRLGLPIEPLLQAALEGLPIKVDLSATRLQLSDFFLTRVENLLKENGLTPDDIKAISTLDIPLLKKRVEFLGQLKASPNFKMIVSAAIRVSNISNQSQVASDVITTLFCEPIEHSLWKLISPLQNELAQMWQPSLIVQLEKVSQVLEVYFKDVMVMAEDPKIRANRIHTLKTFDTAFKQIAQFREL
ncbi:MAG: glycine--tRNA ligase subunit beta, partial [Candidatus Margulisiibacteriota bacterium]